MLNVRESKEGFWRVVGFGFLVLLLIVGGVGLSGRVEAKTYVVCNFS